MPRKISPRLQELVRQRAAFLCEFCHTSEHWQLVPFTVDHLQPVAAGGADNLENLALACFHCHRRKSSRQSVIETGSTVATPLFNPRQMPWAEHFIWSADGLYLLPQSETGRVTIDLLDPNRAGKHRNRRPRVEICLYRNDPLIRTQDYR
ncbi:MAG: HNH endonuclease [Blastocatellia bacterium]